ncbi:hypothetical protein CBU_0394 [Coxiella burnetii RSA 493]|uniref:Uncharacterized protein n=1 Tax=Coxiella burnetii (strain RSA 493 / Nine Mile phase I) TaxID=227377 RepID=Q83ED1_COXBU|nr:hypothetical protein CBU_0394 [Coxiella burnetii RSA 493]BBL37436.1 hypothetical protein CBU406_C15470 [Coxiella burnetii]BBL38209.1 hypothetical protein CBUVS42_C03780 [Coxiella burnetii]
MIFISREGNSKKLISLQVIPAQAYPRRTFGALRTVQRIF